MEKAGIVRGHQSPGKRQQAREMRRKMTRAETVLWQRVRANRLGGLQFRRQQVIDGFIADFYCHAAGLIVEVDGGVHAKQTDYDAERDRILSARGLRILRFTNERVERDIEAVLTAILEACSS